MSFVTIAPPDPTEEAPISSGAFWPLVDPVKMREAQRIDSTITAARLRDALIAAISTVNAELSSFRESNIAAGYTTLAAVPADEIDTVSVHVHRYQRAVGCFAKANLIERYRDFDSTAKSGRQTERKTELLEDPIDDLRRDARWAISDIRGIGRTTVELI